MFGNETHMLGNGINVLGNELPITGNGPQTLDNRPHILGNRPNMLGNGSSVLSIYHWDILFFGRLVYRSFLYLGLIGYKVINHKCTYIR